MAMFLVQELVDQVIDSGIRRCKGNVGMLRQLQSQLKVPYFLVLFVQKDPYFLVLFVQSGTHIHEHSIELSDTLLSLQTALLELTQKAENLIYHCTDVPALHMKGDRTATWQRRTTSTLQLTTYLHSVTCHYIYSNLQQLDQKGSRPATGGKKKTCHDVVTQRYGAYNLQNSCTTLYTIIAPTTRNN